jgi:hypothetical protein
MRSAVGFIILCFAAELAFAQAVPSPNATPAKSLPSSGAKTPQEIKDIDDRVSYWRTTCLDDWDAQTHMTRKEWRTTCERVAAERGKFLRETPLDSLYRKPQPR